MQWHITAGQSFIITTNKRGPMAEPATTPDVTSTASDRAPSIITLCSNPDKKSAIQPSSGCSIPIRCNLLISIQ